jgi:sugar O-acyltransferase (sialic acid O-acetyltransferase NeuD family)
MTPHNDRVQPQRVVVVGASGQAKVVVDALERSGAATVVGFVDSFKPAGTPWYGREVLGTEDALPDLVSGHGLDGCIVGIGDNMVRGAIAEKIRALLPDFRFVNAVHPRATIAPTARMGEGVLVMAGAVVNPDCVVGDHAIINTNASLDHDSSLGRCASMAPQVVTGGGVTIGDYTAVSIGATITHGRRIGAHTVVGAGSVVVRDIPDHVVAYGCPARVVRSRTEGERYL